MDRKTENMLRALFGIGDGDLQIRVSQEAHENPANMMRPLKNMSFADAIAKAITLDENNKPVLRITVPTVPV